MRSPPPGGGAPPSPGGWRVWRWEGLPPIASYIITQAFGSLFTKAGHTSIDYDTDTIQVALAGGLCTVDSGRHTHVMVADIDAGAGVLDEYGAVSGYARKTLGTKTLTMSSSNNGQAVFSSAAIVYTALAPSKLVNFMIFYRLVTNDADSPLLAVLNLADITQTFDGTNNDVTITPPAGGWFRFANNA